MNLPVRLACLAAIAAALNVTMVAGQSMAAIPPVSTAGSAIGVDTTDAQKAVTDAFNLAHCPTRPCPPNRMLTPTQAELTQFASDMAAAAGWATVAHAPGYLGTTTVEPDVAPGVDEPVPSLLMQVDGDGDMVALWWKTGAGATDWISLAGGTSFLAKDQRRLFFWSATTIGADAILSPRLKTNVTAGEYEAAVVNRAEVVPVVSLATPEGSPGVARFSQGTYRAHVWLKVSSAVGATNFGIGLYMKTGNTLTQLGSTAWTGDVNDTTAAAYDLRVALSEDQIHQAQTGDTDRIYALLSVRTTSTDELTATVVFDELDHVSYVDLPFGVRDSASTLPTAKDRFTGILTTTAANLSVQEALEKIDGQAGVSGEVRPGADIEVRPATSTATSTGVGIAQNPTVSVGTGIVRTTDTRLSVGTATIKAGPGIELKGTSTSTATEVALKDSPTVQVDSSVVTGTGVIRGSLTAGKLPVATGAQSLADSQIFDSGSNVAIGNGTSVLTDYKLLLIGALGVAGTGYFSSSIDAANISVTPVAHDIPKAYADHTIDDGWIKSSIARTTDTRFGIATNLATTASPVGTYTWGGVSTEASRGDHIHSHGPQPIGDGTNHAAVSSSYNGFATPAMLAVSTSAVTGSGTTYRLVQWTGTRVVGDSNVYQNGLDIGIGTVPSNAEGFNQAFDIYGTYHAKSLLRTNAITGGWWANNSGWFGSAAGLVMGTQSNHPFYLASNSTLYATLASGVAAFHMALTAPNITGTPTPYAIPNASSGGTLYSWVPDSVLSINGLTVGYLPIASGTRTLGNSYLYESSGLLYSANANQSSPAAYKVVVDNGSGVISGEHFPHTTSAPLGIGSGPGQNGSSGYLSREDHRHSSPIHVGWTRAIGYGAASFLIDNSGIGQIAGEWGVDLSELASWLKIKVSVAGYGSTSSCTVYLRAYVGPLTDMGSSAAGSSTLAMYNQEIAVVANMPYVQTVSSTFNKPGAGTCSTNCLLRLITQFSGCGGTPASESVSIIISDAS